MTGLVPFEFNGLLIPATVRRRRRRGRRRYRCRPCRDPKSSSASALRRRWSMPAVTSEAARVSVRRCAHRHPRPREPFAATRSSTSTTKSSTRVLKWCGKVLMAWRRPYRRSHPNPSFGCGDGCDAAHAERLNRRLLSVAWWRRRWADGNALSRIVLTGAVLQVMAPTSMARRSLGAVSAAPAQGHSPVIDRSVEADGDRRARQRVAYNAHAACPLHGRRRHDPEAHETARAAAPMFCREMRRPRWRVRAASPVSRPRPKTCSRWPRSI